MTVSGASRNVTRRLIGCDKVSVTSRRLHVRLSKTMYILDHLAISFTLYSAEHGIHHASDC